jgi:hypothetical protein
LGEKFMTAKVYKTAQGQTVDIGALILQNETVRAVGNMNVNARGDLLDGNNQIIDQKNRQVQRQYQRQTQSQPGVAPPAPATNTVQAKKQQAQQLKQQEMLKGLDVDAPVVTSAPVEQDTPAKGLAGAMSRARTNQSE